MKRRAIFKSYVLERLKVFSKTRAIAQCFTRDRGTDQLHRIRMKLMTFLKATRLNVCEPKINQILIQETLALIPLAQLNLQPVQIHIRLQIFYPDSQ